jgi:manganese/zinc/iron transport system substrate-binding protein
VVRVEDEPRALGAAVDAGDPETSRPAAPTIARVGELTADREELRDRADLVVASGLHLEGKLADLLERLSRRVPLIAVADAIPASRLLDAGAGLHDPHVWFDAELWSLGVPAVAERLAKLDPPHAEAYREAGRDYAERLVALDGELRESLAEIPLERRVMVTAHDAYRYFGRAYGIEVVGIQGTSTES